MKKINSFVKYALVAFSVTTFGYACTDVDEDLYSQVSEEEYLNNILKNYTDDQYAQAFLSAYAPLTAFGGHNNITSDQEVSSDEVAIPTRGKDWGDGGQWTRMHTHKFTANEESLNNSWKSLYLGVATCNRLIKELPAIRPEKAAPTIAELRALRAFYYLNLCDMFGGVPLIVTYPGVVAEAAPKTRAEIYAFIEKELVESSAGLSKNVDATTYGRMNYWVAKSTLARLYTNAEVYTGAAQWDKVIRETDEIITANKYRIESNYYANFSPTNNNSMENIFVVPFDAAKLKDFNLAQMTLHYESKATFNMQEQPWNGYCTVADFYNSYAANDARKANFIVGFQKASNGVDTLKDQEAESTDPDGKPLNFTPEINQLAPSALRQAGARIGKYKVESGATRNLNNDFPLFRYADILLMKAEALWRKNNADPTALSLVNQIRSRAGATAFTTLTANDLLAERGRELFYEAVRRTDIIRFGKFTQAYAPFKTEVDPACKTIFPIPQPQLNANKSLKQSSCYQ
ncbi:MAG: hypothetical protein RL757_2144 [Bacteroidota bacterium]|jgi:hypothetical protein